LEAGADDYVHKLYDKDELRARIGELTQKMMRITEYRSKEYLGGRRSIVDIQEASLELNGEE
jgi:DNA-binding response OmpR family regulator